MIIEHKCEACLQLTDTARFRHQIKIWRLKLGMTFLEEYNYVYACVKQRTLLEYWLT